MANTSISVADVNLARNFLVQYLRDVGYEGSLEDGTAQHDIVIKGIALLYALFKQDRDRASAYLSLDNAERFKDLLGDDYDVAVDSILSNWFVTRKDGQATRATLRLYFSKELDYLRFLDTSVLFSIQGEDFHPAREYVFTDSDFTPRLNSVNNTNEFYVDIEVTSVRNVFVGITSEDRVTSYINNIFFIRATATGAATPGIDQESSEDFISRTTEVITTRELISDRAIKTVLLDQFDGVTTVYVARHGSPEQQRDLKVFQTVTVHVGNKADIYVRAPYVLSTVERTLDALGEIDLSGLYVLNVFATRTKDGEDEYTVSQSFQLSNVEETLWGSVKATRKLSFQGLAEGAAVEVTYLTCPTIPDVHQFVTSLDNRVACYDPLVKSMHPVILTFNIEITPTAQAEAQYSEAEIQSLVAAGIIEFVKGIGHGETFHTSRLITHLHNEVAVVSQVTLPLSVSFSVKNPVNGAARTGNVVDEFVLPGDMSQQISWNTAQFYTDESFITVRLDT